MQKQLPLVTKKDIQVLVVDDSPIITERIAAMAGEPECVSRVLVSGDYESAVKIIDKEQPEVVLLDIHLPFRSGIDILIYLRKNYPHIRVLMVTNKVSAFYRDVCKEEGASGFIDKSKEFEKIPKIIELFASQPYILSIA